MNTTKKVIQKSLGNAQNSPAIEPRQTNSRQTNSRQALIAVAAYFLAQQRGFIPGYEQQDWFAAERLLQTLHPTEVDLPPGENDEM